MISIPSMLLLLLAGLGSGILAGLLGIGGGTVLVPILVALGHTIVQSVATSGLAIVITSISGTVQNWRMGVLHPKQVLALGFPALVTAQLGVILANWSKGTPYILLGAFGILLWVNIYLVELRKRLTAHSTRSNLSPVLEQDERTMVEVDPNLDPDSTLPWNPTLSRLVTGGLAGLLAGVFGVGGGVIMVPLQMVLLNEPIKVAIQTSLGVVVLTSLSACIGHTLSQNILFLDGLLLGIGGLVGAQLSTRLLPKLPDRMVSFIFRGFLAALSIYIFYQAWVSYQALR